MTKIYTGCQFNIASLKCRESRRAAVEFDSKHKTQVISYEGHVKVPYSSFWAMVWDELTGYIQNEENKFRKTRDRDE